MVSLPHLALIMIYLKRYKRIQKVRLRWIKVQNISMLGRSKDFNHTKNKMFSETKVDMF